MGHGILIVAGIKNRKYYLIPTRQYILNIENDKLPNGIRGFFVTSEPTFQPSTYLTHFLQNRLNISL